MHYLYLRIATSCYGLVEFVIFYQDYEVILQSNCLINSEKFGARYTN